MTKFKILLLHLLLIMNSCNYSDNKQISQDEKIENKIIFQTGAQLKKEKKLIPIGFGGSSHVGKEFLEISFQYFQPLSIDDAREIILYSAQTFVDNLNKNDDLKKLKKSYKMENINIVIYIYMPDHSKPLSTNIGLVEFSDNKIVYSYNNQKYEKVYEESYENALEKLKKKS